MSAHSLRAIHFITSVHRKGLTFLVSIRAVRDNSFGWFGLGQVPTLEQSTPLRGMRSSRTWQSPLEPCGRVKGVVVFTCWWEVTMPRGRAVLWTGNNWGFLFSSAL